MHPHSKHRPLFFTPRSPWGGRLKNQSFRRHMRASEDEKLDPASKNAQGLAGQMAPNQPGGSGGQPGGSGNDVWKVPHTSTQDYQVPQPPQPAKPGPLSPPNLEKAQRATQNQWRFADPVTYPGEDRETHWSGSVGRSGGRHPKEEPDDTRVKVQWSSHPRVNEAEEKRRQAEQKISPKYPEQVDEEEQDERALMHSGPWRHT